MSQELSLALLGLLTCYQTKRNLYLQYQPLEVERRKKISSWQNHLFSLEEMSCLVFQKGENSQQRKQKEGGHCIRQLLFCCRNSARVLPLPPHLDDINPSPSTTNITLLEGPYRPGMGCISLCIRDGKDCSPWEGVGSFGWKLRSYLQSLPSHQTSGAD